jgi:hypothetical protein
VGTTPTNGVAYDAVNSQLVYYSEKSFIIDHPLDENKYLVHICLEGPEAGVYYRGIGEIINNESTTIELPDYVEALAYNFTINLTPIYNGNMNSSLQATIVENNKFSVYGTNTKFYWIVYGTRCNINTEPNKSDVEVKGSGPYKWI